MTKRIRVVAFVLLVVYLIVVNVSARMGWL